MGRRENRRRKEASEPQTQHAGLHSFAVEEEHRVSIFAVASRIYVKIRDSMIKREKRREEKEKGDRGGYMAR